MGIHRICGTSLGVRSGGSVGFRGQKVNEVTDRRPSLDLIPSFFSPFPVSSIRDKTSMIS